jgi:hypothetical protein
VTLEVCGSRHNTLGGFLGLRVELYAAGTGTASFREHWYRRIVPDTATLTCNVGSE